MRRELFDSELFQTGAALVAMVMVFSLKFMVEPPRIVVLFVVIILTMIITFTYKPSQQKENFTKPENFYYKPSQEDKNFTNLSIPESCYYKSSQKNVTNSLIPENSDKRFSSNNYDSEKHHATKKDLVDSELIAEDKLNVTPTSKLSRFLRIKNLFVKYL